MLTLLKVRAIASSVARPAAEFCRDELCQALRVMLLVCDSLVEYRLFITVKQHAQYQYAPKYGKYDDQGTQAAAE